MSTIRRSIYLALGLALIVGASFVLYRFGDGMTGDGIAFLREIGPFMLIFAFGFLMVCIGLPRKWLPKVARMIGEGS